VLFHGKVTIRHYELIDDYLEDDDYEEEDWDDMDDDPEEY
jgi:hypothetical protein